MPKIPSAQNESSQNSHYRHQQSRYEELRNTKHNNTLPPTNANSSQSLGNDWSSLTQEFIDTLPQVWTRGLLYLLVVFAAILLPWAMLSKVDETGSARGRLEPQGRTLRLDAPVAGTVAAIKVKEGATVKAGQILLEMDSQLTRTLLQEAQAKLEGQLNRIPQLELMQNQLDIVIRAQRLQRQAQQFAQLAQIDSSRQRLNFSKNDYALAKDRRDMDLLEVQRYRSFVQQGVVPQVKLVELKHALNESQRLLNQAQSDIQQARYEIKQQQSNYENIVRTGELTTLESERRIKEIQFQIITLKAEIIQTRRQIQSLQFQMLQRIVRAPIDGTIFQLSIENPGSVLSAGKTIAQIAPKGSSFIFRAQMPSQQSGFLRVGMPVKLKFDAYPFQDYGVVPGHLHWISPDSKLVETSPSKLESFELEIALEKPYIQAQNKRIVLTPGQTATAEVIVRQRRVIDFVLDPFKKLQEGGLNI